MRELTPEEIQNFERSVQMHGWRTNGDGDQEHCEAKDAPNGWCVYTRIETPDDPQQPFDVVIDQDFATLDDAQAEAERLSALYNCDVETY